MTVTATASCWIDPYGTFYPVEFASHYEFARGMVDERHIPEISDDYGPVDTLERIGWLHISNFNDREAEVSIHSHRRIPSQSQTDTLFDWACAYQNVNRRWSDMILDWIQKHTE